MDIRTVAFLVCLLSALACGQPDQQLVADYDRSYAAGEYEEALEAAELICSRYPTSGWWHFCAGSLQAKLGRPEEAIRLLGICADAGFTGIRSFEQNTDLDPIRSIPDFGSIIARVRENAAQRLAEFKVLAEEHKPLVHTPEPISAEEKFPIVIALHGTGMRGEDMFDAMRDACRRKRVVLVAPDALRRNGGGFAWTYRDESEWLIDDMIDRAVRDHRGDRSRVLLVGFSQGANIALTLVQTQPKKFQAVVPICGHYEPQVAQSGEHAVLAPCYLMTGSKDQWRESYAKASKDFESNGGITQLHVLKGRGHELPRGTSGTRAYLKAIEWGLTQKPRD